MDGGMVARWHGGMEGIGLRSLCKVERSVGVPSGSIFSGMEQQASEILRLDFLRNQEQPEKTHSRWDGKL